MFNKDTPLGLPAGSVRAIVFISLIFALIYYAYFDTTVRGVVSNMANIAMGFYFAKKVYEKKGDIVSMKIVAVVSLSSEDIENIDWGKVFSGDISEIVKKVKIESVRME